VNVYAQHDMAVLEARVRDYPTPGTTLTIAVGPDGGLWSASLAAIEPAVLMSGWPVPTGGPGTARTVGAAELPDPRSRTVWGTDVTMVLACPFRLVWGRPSGEPASWVPAWALLHDSGRLTIVDQVRTEALTAGIDLVPLAETAALVRAMGWQYELIAPDTSVVRDELADVVLQAPDGVISDGLWSAAVLGAPVTDLLDSIVTPTDLLWVRPYLLDCADSSSARLPFLPPGR